MKRTLALALPVLCILMTSLVAQESKPRVVTISAKRFEFTPNQITLKRDEPVTLRVSTEDRAHGFYQEGLDLALDVTPDHVSEITITPRKAGRFWVICDHFCGSGHGNMKMIINVE